MLKRHYKRIFKPSVNEIIRSNMSTDQGKKIFFGPFEVTSQVFLTTPYSFALVNLKPLLPGHVLVCPFKPHKRLTDLSAPEVTDLFSTVQRVQRMLARHYFKPSGPSSSFSSSSSSSPTPLAGTTFSSPHHATATPGPSSSSSPPSTSSPSAGEALLGGSFNIAVQDGPEAGQTVAHVHVHVIPRIRDVSSKPDDGSVGDELYERMAGEEGNVGGALWDREAAALAACGARRPEAGGRFDRIEDSSRKARSMGEMEAEAGVFRAVLRELELEDEPNGSSA